MAPGVSPPEKTAPGSLELVQRFVNSVDLETGEDELATPHALRGWFTERGLMGAGERVGPADLRRAVDVREGLRALLLRTTGCRSTRRGSSASTKPPPGQACGSASRRRPAPSSCRARPAPTARSPACSRSWPKASRAEHGPASRHARARTARGPSTTTRKTAQAAGAGWPSAETSRRPRPSERAAEHAADPGIPALVSRDEPQPRTAPSAAVRGASPARDGIGACDRRWRDVADRPATLQVPRGREPAASLGGPGAHAVLSHLSLDRLYAVK